MSESADPPQDQKPAAVAAYWTEVYKDYERALFYVAGAYLPRGCTICGWSAEDVVAQTFTEVIARGIPAAGDDVGRHLLWLVGCRARNVLRRVHRVGQGDPDVLPSDDEPVETVVARAMIARAVQGVLDVLDDRRRFAFLERGVKGRPAKEVAVDLGCTSQRVAQLEAEAALKLRVALEDRTRGGER